MICPECREKKERGEGPFAPRVSAQAVLGILGVIAFAVFFLGFWLPGFLEMQERHREFERRNQEIRRNIDEGFKRGGPERPRP
jgi:hypothetical protein